MTLKERRVAAKLTQEDVARAIEVDQSTVSNWERLGNIPLRKYQKKVAELYGCTLDKLQKNG